MVYKSSWSSLGVAADSVSTFPLLITSHFYGRTYCNQKDSLRYDFDPFRWVSLMQGIAVRLGKSGLKVSRIILGMMSYGDPAWLEWVLGEKEAIEHIKFA
jgi:hypothetical protein